MFEEEELARWSREWKAAVEAPRGSSPQRSLSDEEVGAAWREATAFAPSDDQDEV